MSVQYWLSVIYISSIKTWTWLKVVLMVGAVRYWHILLGRYFYKKRVTHFSRSTLVSTRARSSHTSVLSCAGLIQTQTFGIHGCAPTQIKSCILWRRGPSKLASVNEWQALYCCKWQLPLSVYSTEDILAGAQINVASLLWHLSLAFHIFIKREGI